MSFQITSNPRSNGSGFAISTNTRARANSIVSVDWDNVTGKPNSLVGIGDLTGTGIVAITDAAGAAATRTITGTASQITVTNGDGVSGNPTISIPYTQPTSYPVTVTYGHSAIFADSDVQFGNLYSQYPLGSVSTNPITVGKQSCTIGSATNGQTFKIVFTSSGLTGSPITITYTAGAGETVTTVAQGLATLVNANTTLHGTGGKPIFMQSLGSGVFNLQYDSAFSSTGATPLTTTTTGSTGTINLSAEGTTLDYILMQLGRNVSGRAAVAGDALYALDFTGQDSTGTFNTHYGQITIAISSPTAGATRGKMYFNTAGGAEAYFDKGLALFDTSGVIASGGTLGLGSINIPAVGKFSIDNVNNIRRNSGSSQFVIEATNSDSIIISGSGGIGLNATPTGNALVSALGAFVTGTQVPTANANGVGVVGGTSPTITARNYGTATGLPLLVAATDFSPSANDGVPLGTTSKSWSDLFMASGGVINWNAGDVTVTHSADTLAFAGAANGYTFDNPLIAGTFKAASGTAKFSAASQVGVNVKDTNGAIGVNTASPATQFHVHMTTDQNSIWVDGTTAANPSNLGVGIWSIKDDLATLTPLSLKGSQFIFNTGGVGIGTNTDPGAGALLANTSIKSQSATAGIGYATGAGGAVTQLTSRTTGVTLNTASGAITLFAAAPAVGTWVSFTVTNSAVAATDVPYVSFKSGTNTYIGHVTAVAAGSFQISFTSIVGTSSDSPVINFAIIKGVTS